MAQAGGLEGSEGLPGRLQKAKWCPTQPMSGFNAADSDQINCTHVLTKVMYLERSTYTLTCGVSGSSTSLESDEPSDSSSKAAPAAAVAPGSCTSCDPAAGNA